jgi:hypothetical protein
MIEVIRKAILEAYPKTKEVIVNVTGREKQCLQIHCFFRTCLMRICHSCLNNSGEA